MPGSANILESLVWRCTAICLWAVALFGPIFLCGALLGQADDPYFSIPFSLLANVAAWSYVLYMRERLQERPVVKYTYIHLPPIFLAGGTAYYVACGLLPGDVLWIILPVAFVWVLLAWLAWRSRGTRVLPGHCAECRYDLTGNVSGRCPECGTAIRRTD